MWTNKYVGEGAYKNFRKKKPSQIFEFTITWNGIVLLIRILTKKKKKYSVAQEANIRPVSAHVSCSVYSCFNTS